MDAVLRYLLVITINTICYGDTVEKVVRRTTYGDVVGTVRRTEKGAEALVFLGVPYAQPPVGDLRLKYPVPPKPWSKPHNATFARPWCIQFWYFDERVDLRPQSEDCLYMNIFTPYNNTKPRPYPVLLWIHGGSYQVGGANAFPIDSTIDNIASKGVLVIIINYRLGPLGFMSSLNYNLPGNYGLEDQLMALRWAKANAHFFDGDPNLVTIAGESAGAASVSLLGISPKAIGYFQRMIIRSGSSLSKWAVRTSNTDLNTNRLIKNLGCGDSETAPASVDGQKTAANNLLCLQLKDSTAFEIEWRNIANRDQYLIMSRTDEPNYNHPLMAHTYFTPVVDSYRLNDSILPHYAEELMKKAPAIPVMLGTTTGECAGYISYISNIGFNIHDLEHVVPSMNYVNAEQIKQATYKKYIGDAIWEPTFNFKKALVDIASDQNFVAPIALEARIYSKKQAPVYAYVFDHGNEDLYSRFIEYGLENVGAAHGFDLIFLFQSTAVVDMSISRYIYWNEQDLRITAFLSESLYNFVAFGSPNDPPAANRSSDGDPSFKTVDWPLYSERCRSALNINGSGTSLVDFHPQALEFWVNTVGVLESVTLRSDYQFQTPANSCVVSRINYKTAFYTTLCLLLTIVVGVGSWFIFRIRRRRRRRRRSSAKNGDVKALTVSIPML